MGVWTDFVDLIYTTLVGLSTILGGNMGLAIGVLSLSVRLALLPLTLWIARRSLEAQAALKKLEPQISSIRKKTQGRSPESLGGNRQSSSATWHQAFGRQDPSQFAGADPVVFRTLRGCAARLIEYGWIPVGQGPDAGRPVACKSLRDPDRSIGIFGSECSGVATYRIDCSSRCADSCVSLANQCRCRHLFLQLQYGRGDAIVVDTPPRRQ